MHSPSHEKHRFSNWHISLQIPIGERANFWNWKVKRSYRGWGSVFEHWWWRRRWADWRHWWKLGWQLRKVWWATWRIEFSCESSSGAWIGWIASLKEVSDEHLKKFGLKKVQKYIIFNCLNWWSFLFNEFLKFLIEKKWRKRWEFQNQNAFVSDFIDKQRKFVWGWVL
jgi:hypothetical protein